MAMLRIRSVVRLACTASRLCAAMSTDVTSTNVVVQKIDKEALKQLRQRTGYSYVNCRKALLEFGPERLKEAEKWLRELAAKEGWTKAAKLGHRETRNGLVAVIAEGHTAAVVEVNCETDFVARGQQFKSLVEEITLSALTASKEFAATSSASGDRLTVRSKPYETIKSLSEDRLLKELLASVIGKLGENITVSKLQFIIADPGVSLYGYAHPREGTDRVDMGKYVSVVGLSQSQPDSFPIHKLGQQICQHIIGMRSETLGPPTIEPKESKESQKDDEAKREKAAENGTDVDDEVQTTQIDETETRLLQQSFMLNPTQTVYEYVSGHGARIVDFFRAEIGEYAEK